MLISLKAHLIEYLRGYHRIRLFIYLILLLLMAIPQGWTVSAQEVDLSSGTREADSMNKFSKNNRIAHAQAVQAFADQNPY